MATLTEADVEAAALAWLEGVGWGVALGADVAPGADGAERADYGGAALERRLRDGLGAVLERVVDTFGTLVLLLGKQIRLIQPSPVP